MFIQTEETPNPATLKFLPGRMVMERGTADFDAADKAARSPLAESLFRIDGVARIFLGSDFITVTKTDQKDWPVLKPQILGLIMEHFSSNRPVILSDDSASPPERLATKTTRSWPRSRNCWIPASVPRLPRMAATSSSTPSRMAWCICTCRAHARAARLRPRP